MRISAQPASPPDQLAVDCLSVKYGDLTALSDVSLSVRAGQVVAVVGPNGAGKSSMLRCISGLVPPSAGRCLLQGRDLRKISADGRCRLGLGHVPEGRRLFPALTVFDNLRVAAIGCTKGHEDPIAEQFELFPELGRLSNRRAESLSGGEQQMVAIARALIQQPRVLLMDEPSLGLAPIIVKRVGAAIVQAAESGTAVLLAEQNVELALSVAHHIHVLVLGKLAETLNMVELRANHGAESGELARNIIIDAILART